MTNSLAARTAIAIALLIIAAAPAVSQAPVDSFRTRLMSAAFEPSRDPMAGDGEVTATLRGQTIRIEGRFSGLDSPAMRARLLTGPAVGVPAGTPVAELRLSAQARAGSLTGEAPAAFLPLLRGNRLYVQIETEAVPDGALWGWLMPNHPFPGENVPEKANWYAQ